MWSGLLLMQTVRPLDSVLSLMVRQGCTLLFYLLKDLVAASSLGESTRYFAPGWRCFAVHYKECAEFSRPIQMASAGLIMTARGSLFFVDTLHYSATVHRFPEIVAIRQGNAGREEVEAKPEKSALCLAGAHGPLHSSSTIFPMEENAKLLLNCCNG
ncbi:hypothetical protein An04g02680 [Aspergillus niger]|uniref:Uncharacterized protein n=2 Tax=Aspergillus niger TaxID=5061 RepID=A2QI90_ASPNC|nr:hypothetical protein An04g02680 [Aspergillus niger]CAK96435.1 hypothetical protein An04g02680 [Aspergillus niger]